MADDVDSRSGVRLIGGEIAYADGSEDPVLAILEGADDRTTGSDELARHATDWPTRYHLSRQRANLLRPLRFGPGMRVLDVGAGTGALTRHVAEQGADVVAIEGVLTRARAVAARCGGLDNVEVVCGPMESFVDASGFDVVLCVGVLEYSGLDAESFLRQLGALVRPDGVVVVAIENQLGLKYLLGYGEDHLGEPWVGVEGYRASLGAGVRTYSRRALGTMLAQAGFGAQRWLFPFPDYKLPSVVLDESIYAELDATDFVDQLVRWPCSPLASEPSRVCDDRWAHRVLLDAGLGPEVANSFLVVGGRDASAGSSLVDGEAAAWFFGSERARLWLGSKRFPSRSVGGEVEASELAPTERITERGWLLQRREARQPHIVGRTVEQLALDACEQGPEELAAVLTTWRDHLRGREVPVGADRPLHPFAPIADDPGARLLAGDHLDVNLGNFVAAGGELHYVDSEWQVAGGVDADLVCVRALWWFAADVVARAVRHPWPLSTTVDELAEIMGGLCSTPAYAAMVSRFRDVEAQLHAKVTGLDVAVCHAEMTRVGSVSQVSPGSSRYLPFTALRHALARSHEQLADMGQQLELARTELLRSLEEQAARYDQLGRDGHATLLALGAEQRENESLRSRLESSERRWAALERKLSVRVYRRLKRLVG